MTARRSQGGAGAILLIAVVAVIVTAAAGMLSVLGLLVARQRAANAADAAALAAADAASGAIPGVPCELAARAAALNGALIVDCRIDDGTAAVAAAAGWLGIDIIVGARAGPPPGDG